MRRNTLGQSQGKLPPVQTCCAQQRNASDSVGIVARGWRPWPGMSIVSLVNYQKGSVLPWSWIMDQLIGCQGDGMACSVQLSATGWENPETVRS